MLDAAMLTSSFDTTFLDDMCEATALSKLLSSFLVGSLKPSYDQDNNLLYNDGALVIPTKDLQTHIS
jgi:hypothetical protein